MKKKITSNGKVYLTRKIAIVLIGFLIVLSSQGQKQEKMYFDAKWKGCQPEEAKFYRLVNFDKDGKPTGKIYDYYITGELQAIVDGALSINSTNDYESVLLGFLMDIINQVQNILKRITTLWERPYLTLSGMRMGINHMKNSLLTRNLTD